MHANNPDSFLIACIFSVSSEINGDAGAGFLSASANIRAVAVVLSVADVVGMSMSSRKNSIVHAMRSVQVLVM